MKNIAEKPNIIANPCESAIGNCMALLALPTLA